VLRISPVEPLSALPNDLSDLNAKLAPDGQIVIEYRSVADLRTEEADLEDVFMALTYSGDAQ